MGHIFSLARSSQLHGSTAANKFFEGSGVAKHPQIQFGRRYVAVGRQKTFGPAMGKTNTWKINKCSLIIVRVLFAFGATARHSCELQPPAEPMPRRRTLLSGRRCQPSRQTSTRVGHMLFHFCLLGKGAEINALPGRKILMNLFTHLWSPCPPIDSSKVFCHHLCV